MNSTKDIHFDVLDADYVADLGLWRVGLDLPEELASYTILVPRIKQALVGYVNGRHEI